MRKNAFQSFVGRLPASMPDELRAALRGLERFPGPVEDFLDTIRLATELTQPFSAGAESDLVDSWVATPPTHARYCFLAEA